MERINTVERERLENELGKVIFDPTANSTGVGGAITNFDTLQKRVKVSFILVVAGRSPCDRRVRALTHSAS